MELFSLFLPVAYIPVVSYKTHETRCLIIYIIIINYTNTHVHRLGKIACSVFSGPIDYFRKSTSRWHDQAAAVSHSLFVFCFRQCSVQMACVLFLCISLMLQWSVSHTGLKTYLTHYKQFFLGASERIYSFTSTYLESRLYSF